MDRINGTILKPGEVFSFNKVVGRRTIRNGFYEALEMVYGDLVTGIGGGVCQPSSTLFQAALLAGLGITDRSNHSEPVNYTDRGLDATVYWVGDRQIDFKFKITTGEIGIKIKIIFKPFYLWLVLFIGFTDRKNFPI